MQAATATSTATSVVNAGSWLQTSAASTCVIDDVPRRTTISDTAASSDSPPRNVMNRVRIEAAWPPRPERAMSRNDAIDVISQVTNSSTRSSASTRPTIDAVNSTITSEKLSCRPRSR